MHAAAMVETVVEANMAGCWVGRADAWVVGAERVVEAVTVAKWADAVVAGNTVGVRVEGVVMVVAAAATAEGVGQTVVAVVTVVMGAEVVAAEDLVDVGGPRVEVAVVEEVAVAEEVGWFAGSQEAKVKVETVAKAKRVASSGAVAGCRLRSRCRPRPHLAQARNSRSRSCHTLSHPRKHKRDTHRVPPAAVSTTQRRCTSRYRSRTAAQYPPTSHTGYPALRHHRLQRATAKEQWGRRAGPRRHRRRLRRMHRWPRTVTARAA